METNTADEQDLVKALDGAVSSLSSNEPAGKTTSSDPAFEEVAASLGSDPVVLPGSPVAPSPLISDLHGSSSSLAPAATDDTASVSDQPVVDTASGPLEAIKQDALTELRPLVDKLTVSPAEKFDTYLLLIRSTDDASLIAPAHEAAKAISDETRRAEALLDIIKEIDFLSKQEKTA